MMRRLFKNNDAKPQILSPEMCLYLAPPCGGGGGRKAIS
jgi:hypothetical protein